MPIETGQTLLHYRIADKIGEGGMGQVWRAVDTTLDREVAIKVLPPSDARSKAAPGSDPNERLARFEREAKLLASLNHPNIAAVYGLHEDAGQRFIAMEWIAGEDLAVRIDRGPLPPAEALTIARQVVAALAAAHDNGVIHRDLKPANIRLTTDGQVKVLDFGLAKAFDVADGSGSAMSLSRSPTMTSAGTRAGMILGTAAYMSPEQARGKPVDRRADIWAFGCVLHEMLTGRQTFTGETVTDVLAAILTRDPELSALAGSTPRSVLQLLERCLEKEPARRLRDAGDIGLELDTVLAGGLEAADAGHGETRGKSGWLTWGLVTAGALVLGALLGNAVDLGGTEAAPSSEPLRVAITGGDGQAIRDAKLSRDGRYVVMLLKDGAYIRSLDSFDLKPIPGLRDFSPWAESPNGRSLAVFTSDDTGQRGRLGRIELSTGTTATIAVSTDGELHPVLWREDGIVVLGKQDGIISVVDVGSGTVDERLSLPAGHFHGATPIPGTSAVLLSVHDAAGPTGEWNLQAYDVDQRELSPVFTNARDGYVTTSGHLLFLRNLTLFGSAFDRASLEPVGEAVPLFSGVRRYSVSTNGTLLYMDSQGGRGNRIVRIDRAGEQELLAELPGRFVRYAPNERWISVVTPGAIQLLDNRNGSVRPLASPVVQVSDHVWRSDSQALIYTGFSEDGSVTLFEHPLDGSAPRVLMEIDAEDGVQFFPTGHAPDGSGTILARYEGDDSDLWWLPAAGGAPRPLLQSPAFEDLGRFSHDGKLVAYQSNAGRRTEIWVAAYRPDVGLLAERWQVTRGGGRDPIWSADGRELYYEDADDRLMRIPVTRDADGRPGFGTHETLFDLRELNGVTRSDESYDVAPSGDEWVLVLEPGGAATAARLVFNWFDELERAVPGVP